jgi:hypothetical protein
VTQRMFRFWLHPDIFYKKTSTFVKEITAKDNSAFRYTEDVLRNVQKIMKNEAECDEKPKNFIRALVSPKAKLYDEELKDEIKTLLIAVIYIN